MTRADELEELRDRAYYRPVDAGLEIRLREKLEALREARAAALREAGKDKPT